MLLQTLAALHERIASDLITRHDLAAAEAMTDFGDWQANKN
jgi:hypothetical protein